MKTLTIKNTSLSKEQQYTIQPGDKIVFDFDPTANTFERTGSDLTIVSSETGETIVLTSFFEAGEEGLPLLQLPNGEQINAADFLRALDSNFDISTAAGPSQSASSSGVNAYSDGAGSLVDGIDTLGSLGTDQWGGIRTAGAIVNTQADASLPESPTTPIDLKEDGYHTRLVVTNEGRTSFSFSAIDKNGNPVTDASRLDVQFLDGSDYFVFEGFDAAGNITVVLTQAGIDALQAGTLVDDMLTIEVDGEAYKMPLVINSGQNYNAADEEARANLGTDLKAEWYSTESSLESKSVILGGSAYNQVDVDGDLIAARLKDSTINTAAGDASVINIRGYMQASGSTVNTIKGGTGDDSVSIDGRVEGGRGTNIIDLGDGKNTISIGGELDALYGANTITGGAGDDNVSIDGHVNAKYGTNTIDLGDGKNTISIGGEVYANYSANTITGGAGDDSVTIKGNVQADRSTNTIDLGAGSNTIFIGGGVDVGYGGVNTITGSAGNDKVTITESLSVTGYEGKNTIDLGDGKNTISIGGGVATTGNSGVNTITGGAGDDSVTITESLVATNRGKNTVDLGDGKNTISIGGDLDVFGGSVNTIKGGTGDDSVSIDGTLKAHNGSTNSIDLGGGTNTIVIGGVVDADSRSVNSIVGGSGDDNVTITGSLSVKAGGTNTIDLGDGRNVINIKGYVDAGNWSVNTITGGVGNDDVNITESLRVTDYGGTNTIDLGDGINTISIEGNLDGKLLGANTIIGGSDNDSVTINGNVKANDGTNTIDLGAGTNTINIKGEISAGNAGVNSIIGGAGEDNVHLGHTLKSDNGGTNTVDLGDGTNTLTIASSLTTRNAGENTVLGGSGDDKVTSGQIFAASGGKNLIDLGTGADSIEARGIVAQNTGSSNTLKSGGDVILSAGDSPLFAGIYSTDAGNNTIVAGGDVTVNATNYALYASGDWGNTPSTSEALRTNTNISAGNDINLSAKATDSVSNASGVYGQANVGIKLEAERDITIKAEGKYTQGVSGSHKTYLTAGNNISISAKATGMGMGLHASGNLNAGNKVTVDVLADDIAYGAHTLGASTLNVSAKEVEITAMSNTSDASGIYAYDRGRATVEAETISIEAMADGTGSAYGLRVKAVSNMATEANPNAETFALLQGNDITLVAEAKDTGNAYGMYIQGPTNNTSLDANNIAALNNDHSLMVTIIAKSGTAGNAYAMWAEYDNATNTITGSDKADSITLVGDFHAAHTGKNVINTGGGDDVISLHGKVDSIGSLHLNAGEGYDILTLVADNFAQFEEYYGAWLKATFGTMDVEAIHINIAGLTEADQNALDTFFSDSMFDNTDFTYLASSDSQANGYSDVASFSALSLGDLISTGEDENVLNMAGNSINSLVINENSLETLLASNGLSRIMGDSADTISFETVGWVNSGNNTVVDGVMYDTYLNNDATILIQQDIIVNIVG